MSDQKVTMRTRRFVMPYIHLFESASIAIQQAENSEENQFHNCLTAILFSAFCIEAYLHHIGGKYFEDWEKFERKLEPKKKLLHIADKHMNFRPDFSRRPFQSFSEIFDFRNTLVHGKTQVLEHDTKQEITEEPIPPLADWEKFCTIKRAKKLYGDTEEIIRILHSYTPDTREDPFQVLFLSATQIIYEEYTFDDMPPATELLEDWWTKQHTLASYLASKKAG